MCTMYFQWRMKDFIELELHTDGFELPYGYWVLNLGPLREEQVLNLLLLNLDIVFPIRIAY